MRGISYILISKEGRVVIVLINNKNRNRSSDLMIFEIKRKRRRNQSLVGFYFANQNLF